MRINKIRTLGVIAVALTAATVVNATINYGQLRTLQAHVKSACPARWEGHLSQIEYQVGDSLWQGDMRDKAAFVKYASTHLKDADGSFLINGFNDDGAIILACGDLKSQTFALMNQDHWDEINAFIFGSDDDGDGVINGMDICPETTDTDIPSGQTYSVNALGCTPWEADTDEDGVTDHIDQCPGSEPGVAVDSSNGCLDSDGDGTSDNNDAYPFQSATQCQDTGAL